MKSIGFGNRLAVCALCALGAFSAFAAKECKWIGGSGNWSVASNWEDGNVPEDGDRVVIDAGETDIAVTNNLGEILLDATTKATVALLVTGTTATVTLAGDKIRLRHTVTDGRAMRTHVKIEVYAPVHIENSAASKCYAELRKVFNFYKPFTFAHPILYLRMPDDFTAYFRDVVQDVSEGRTGTLWRSGGGRVHFMKPVSVPTVKIGGEWCGGFAHFESTGNDIDLLAFDYSGSYDFSVDNALPEKTVIQVKQYGSISMTANVRANRLTTANAAGCTKFTVSVPSWWNHEMTLTLKGTANASADALFEGWLSLVWDPVGDYTQTIFNRASTTTGSLTVKRGTLKSYGSNSFASATALNVLGGTFVNDTTAADSLAGLTAITVSNGVLRVTENCAASTFGTKVATLTVRDGGTLELPEAVTLSVAKAYARGYWPGAGTYTGKGYGTDGVREVDWIVGGGRVTVTTGYTDRTSWTNAEGGDWNDADNWSGGVPTRGGKPVYITPDHESPYVVTMATGDVLPDVLTLSGSGAQLVVPTGAEVALNGMNDDGKTLRTCTYAIRNGAEFRVAGGTAVLTNFYGTFVVSGVADATGRVAVTGGAFHWTPYKIGAYEAYEMTVTNCGEVAVSGGTFYYYSIVNNVLTTGGFRLRGGTLSVSGTGVWDTRNIPFQPGTGRWILSDSACWNHPASANYVLAPNAADEELEVLFGDHASMTGNANSFALFNKATLMAESDAAATFNYAMDVGQDTGTSVWNVVRGNCYVGQRGLSVGTSGGRRNSSGVKGTVNFRGGGVTITGGWADNNRAMGVLVGYGANTYETSGRPYDGLVSLTGTAVTNSNGSTMIGTGYATGLWVQDGGSYLHDADNRICAVGAAGGIGEIVLSNGTFTVDGDMYVGGAFTNSFPNGATFVPKAGWPIGRHDAEGTLTLAGGTFKANKSLILGADGHGTVNRVGAAGTVTVKDLVLSNAVADVTAGGTLKFTLEEGLVAPILVTSKFYIGDGAKLVVDAGDVAPEKKQRLVTLTGKTKTLVGAFDPANISLVGAKAALVKVVPDATGLLLAPRKGFAAILK